MKVIILALASGLQVFCEGAPLAVKGCTTDIPNEADSWRRILDNLNVDPATLHLKIIWEHVDYKVLQHCQKIFPSPASLETEMLASLQRRLGEAEMNVSGEKFIVCFDAADAVEILSKEKKFINNKLKKLQAVLRDRKE
mgnify:CR=1 FL=1